MSNPVFPHIKSVGAYRRAPEAVEKRRENFYALLVA
jgi:hypothetical protein